MDNEGQVFDIDYYQDQQSNKIAFKIENKMNDRHVFHTLFNGLEVLT